MDTSKKFVRVEKDKMIAGVCTGIAQYFNVDVMLVRVLFVLASLFGFSAGFWLYILIWLLVPSDATVKA